MKMSRSPLFFFFCLSLFETTEICLGCTKMEICTGKKAFHAGKKLGNVTLSPLKNIPLRPLYIDIYYGRKFSNLAHLWLHTWLCPWIKFHTTLCFVIYESDRISPDAFSGVASIGARGSECPPDSEKFAKIWKNQEKRGKNWEEKAKIGKILSLWPSWQKGLATLLDAFQNASLPYSRKFKGGICCGGHLAVTWRWVIVSPDFFVAKPAK